MRPVLVLITLLCQVWAQCSKSDYETVLGGYENVHSISTVTFDVDWSSLDLVVGAH